MNQLVVVTTVVGVMNTELIYNLIGDVNAKEEEPGKVAQLLDPDSSLIGVCGARMSGLLDDWLCDKDDGPWFVLSFLRGPVADPRFALFARSTTLRAWSSVSRRHEIRHSTWPYRLWPLRCDKSPRAEKVKVADALIAADREELDVYSLDVRALYKDRKGLLSRGCQTQLQADFDSQPCSTDLIERLNSMMALSSTRRGPARNFGGMSRDLVCDKLHPTTKKEEALTLSTQGDVTRMLVRIDPARCHCCRPQITIAATLRSRANIFALCRASRRQQTPRVVQQGATQYLLH